MKRQTLPFSEPTPSLNHYLVEIRKDALLTADDEARLANAIGRGDTHARTRMIQANLRLVVKIARQFQGRGLSLEDLVGEGNLGLIRAAQDYDPSFGTRFSTYSAYWIKQSIRAALTNTAAVIRLPAHMVGLLGRWRRSERVLARDLGRDPTFHEIADLLDLTAVQRELVSHALKTRHLVREGHQRMDGQTVWSCEETSDPRPPQVAECEVDEERRALRGRLDRLDPRERMVVSLRFGLDGERPLTLQEVGRRLGVTREWVRKIEMRAVRKLDDRPSMWSRPEARRETSRRTIGASRKTATRFATPA